MTRSDLALTEKEWQSMVVEYARLRGWRVYHTHDSRRSQAGYPDLTLVRAERLLFAELKSAGGRVSAAQRAWLDALGATCAETYVWRPDDWEEVVCVLT